MKPQTPQQAEREPIKASDKKVWRCQAQALQWKIEKIRLVYLTQCVILDVGGERFIAQRNALLKYPTTRLGKLMRSATISGDLKKIVEIKSHVLRNFVVV